MTTERSEALSAPSVLGQRGDGLRLLFGSPRAPSSGDIIPTGLESLDAALGGGLGPGLHLVSGARGVGKTAFVEGVLWESVTHCRPVVYYALQEGTHGTWERLVSALAAMVGDPEITLAALRGRTLPRETEVALSTLDAELRHSVLPWLSLGDRVPEWNDSIFDATGGPRPSVRRAAVLSRVRDDVAAARDRQGTSPVVLIDGLERVQPGPDVTTMVDDLHEALVALAVPGVATIPAGQQSFGIVWFSLVPVGSVNERGFRRVDLVVHQTDRRAGSIVVPLHFDRRSRLFASAPTAP